MASHVGDTGGEYIGDNPLQLVVVDASTQHHSQVDAALMQAVYKEMMKTMKGRAYNAVYS